MTRNVSSSEYILLRSSPRHPGPHCLSASRIQCRWINSPPEHMRMDGRALEDVQEMGLGYHACQQHLGVAFPETVADYSCRYQNSCRPKGTHRLVRFFFLHLMKWRIPLVSMTNGPLPRQMNRHLNQLPDI